MSGLELAASLAGLVSLGLECCRGITQYCNSYQGAQKEIELLLEDTSTLMQTLLSLESAMQDSSLRSKLEESVAHIFSACRERVTSLSKELEKFVEPSKGRSERKNISIKRRILYPFQESSLQKLRDDISRINEILQQATSSVLIRQNNKINDTIDRIHDSGELDKIKDWLLPPDFSTSQMIASDKRSENTGSWFVESEEFQQWQGSPCSLLWVSGGAGRGKTVLCSTAINHLINIAGPKHEYAYSSAVAYLYFDQTNHSISQDHNRLLRSLIQQLAAQTSNGAVPAPLKSLYLRSQNGTRPPMTHDLTNTLRSLIQSFSPCYLIADAFDECKDKQMFLKLVNTIIGQWRIPQVRFLVTSRTELNSELPNRSWKGFTLSLDESNNGDVRSYIETTLETVGEPLNDWEPERRKSIAKSLIARSNGNFRWVACQFEVLRRCSTRQELERALETLPATLEETYERTLADIEESRKSSICHILRFLCFSARPMRLDEMSEVLAIDFEARPRPRYCSEQRLEVHKARYFNRYSDLVSIATIKTANEEYSELRLAHLSVRDYLLSTKILTSPASYFYITELSAHYSIAQACIVYLQQFRTRDELPTYEEAVLETPLTRYASRFWFHHVQESIKAAGHQSSVVTAYPTKIDAQQETLIILIIQFLTQLLGLLGIEAPVLKKSSSVKDQLLDLNQLCVDFLVSQGETQIRFFDPDTPWVEKPSASTPGNTRPSPLYTAAQAGFLDVVRQLVRQGMDINSLGGRFGTPLQAAACKGYSDILLFLLKEGADPNLRGGDYECALQGASRFGQETCVQILLDAGVDVNATGGEYHTAAHAAAFHGHGHVLKLLVQNGANIHISRPRGGATPLILAASEGHLAVVELLLGLGADVHVGDSNGCTPLHESAPAGFNEVVKLIIAHDPTILNSQDQLGNTALHYTVAQNFPSTVELLLRSGMDPNIENRRKRTALHNATRPGNIDVVETLLRYGAKTSIGDWEGFTPLHLAAYYDKIEIARMLLDVDGDTAELPVPYGCTPLFISLLKGNVEFVKLLGDHGARFTKQPQSDLTAITCLRLFDNDNAGVVLGNLYMYHEYPVTGLRLAASYGMEVQLRDLLEREADINGTDEGGCTALWWAASSGRNSIVRLLIENGADVNVRTDEGKSFMDCSLDQDIIELAYKHGYVDQVVQDSDEIGRVRRKLIVDELLEYLKGKLPADIVASYSDLESEYE
ncbi:hypothetical protein TWF506_006364 [Arthrobotrys conoides]|uniref:Nephrocystin 3-like N-terminal domain-containing protein n=1 Tax=Arthrobotrys conoides TaxID=74498 RepID=A0AAN8NQY6_9PEZI